MTEKCVPSSNQIIVRSVDEAQKLQLSYPVEVRAAYTFKNHGFGVAYDPLALIGLVQVGLDASPYREVQIQSGGSSAVETTQAQELREALRSLIGAVDCIDWGGLAGKEFGRLDDARSNARRVLIDSTFRKVHVDRSGIWDEDDVDPSPEEPKAPLPEHVHSWDGDQCHYCHIPRSSVEKATAPIDREAVNALALECAQASAVVRRSKFTGQDFAGAECKHCRRARREHGPNYECPPLNGSPATTVTESK